MERIELFYGDGGHSGPFASKADAVRHAQRYLRGLRERGHEGGTVTARASTTSTTDIGGITLARGVGVYASWGALRLDGPSF